MRLLDLFKKNDKKLSDESKDNHEKENISKEMAIQTIASIISGNDSAVIKRTTDCLADGEGYFNEHADAFLERGIEKFDEISLREMQWISMVDILSENQYVCERDWKDELDDFLYFVREQKEMKAAALPLEAEWFDKNADISEWCTIIDGKWKSSGMCLAGIDLESDSYVLFPCRDDKLHELKKLAKILSRRIDYAKNL